MNSIQRRWEGLKENLFGLFYVLTEQKNQKGGGRGWSALRCGLIYLVDAGQLLKALVLAEYGWSAEVIAFVEKFDVIKLILGLVRLYLARRLPTLTHVSSCRYRTHISLAEYAF